MYYRFQRAHCRIAVFSLSIVFLGLSRLALSGSAGERLLPRSPFLAPVAAGKASPVLSKEPHHGLLRFLAERGKRRYEKVPHKVFAFYYTWYGNPEFHGRWIHYGGVRPEEHEIATSTHYPAKGAYDSHNEAIINYHIRLAKANGIDCFIATWWGKGDFTDEAFGKLLKQAESKGFKATVYWETVPGKGAERRKRAVADLLYILKSYGRHPAFFKFRGKPVVFVYGRIMNQVQMAQWPLIIKAVKKQYGRDFILIADGYKEGYARLFDGIHTYNICGWVQNKSPSELRELSRRSFRRAVDMARDHGKISCLTVIPGYNDKKIRDPGINAKRLGGTTYKVLWEEAVSADPDWVLITSWNEWHEGSEIEPSWEHGDKYVKLTGKYASRFKKEPYSKAPVSRKSCGVSAQKAEALRSTFKGKRVGILPDFTSDAVSWLSETGVNFRELTWKEVTEPEVFNASALPVTVYGGHESYRQTVREKRDVDRNLVRYLREGGLLMMLPSGPIPFYYNREGESVSSASKFGLNVLGAGAASQGGASGWENPPNGAELFFKVHEPLRGSLPKRVPFPETGDLRWRPAVKGGLEKGDIYQPLAGLYDQNGRSYGDGIVYIHHKSSPPRKGKIIYIWKRMTDILSKDELLFQLFRLAALKAP